MTHLKISRILCSIAIAALLSPVAWGQSGNPTESKTAPATPEFSGTVKFSHPTVVNGVTIQPGEYQMIAKGKQLKIEDLKSQKLVAESPITWKKADHDFRDTAMDIDKGVLTKVSLAGTNEAVLLHRSRP